MTEEPIPRGAALPDADIDQVMRIIPHRFPFLFLDRIVEVSAFVRAVGIKNVSMNEPYFPGHFPANPIMPGVLIVEAMAQTAAALVIISHGPGAYGSEIYFTGVDGGRFRRRVRPGDQLRLEVVLERQKLGIWRYQGRATVDGELAAEALLTAKLGAPPAAARQG